MSEASAQVSKQSLYFRCAMAEKPGKTDDITF